MTALALSFPSKRVHRTPAQVAQRRQERINASVARLVELLENDPRFRAIADAHTARNRATEERPS